MPAFSSSLVLPDLPLHVQRGGGPSIIFIQVKDDMSAVESGAEWDAITIIQNIGDTVAEGEGSAKQNLSLTLIDGTKYVLHDTSVDEAADNESMSLQVAMTSAEILKLKETTKGKKFYFVRLVKAVGTVKFAQFGFGEFERNFSRTHDFGQIIVTSATVRFIPNTAASPTFPALPANTDALFTTDAANKKYLGWLLAAADATKGGYGNAVANPTTSQLTSSMGTVILEI